MTDTNYEEELTSITPMRWTNLLSVAVVGVVAGIITWAVYWLLIAYITPRFLCSDATTSFCQTAPTIMDGIGVVLGAAVGLLGLIRLRTFRPLLVVLAASLTLVGIAHEIDVMAWYWEAVISILLFALAYALYAWVARVRAFWLAAIIAIVLLVVTRLVLFS